MSAETVTIAALGAQGDGVAETPEGPVYVPFTLPRELVSIAREKARGTLLAIKEPAAERVDPPCPHFGPDAEGGACGGCNLQHLAMAPYATWKRDLVVKALAMQGLTADVAALFECPSGGRRRMVFTARRTEKGILLGFNEAASHRIVPIRTCLVGDPRIVGSLDAIRRVAGAVAATGKPFRLAVLATDTGFDIAATESGRLSPRQRQTAIEGVMAERAVARLTVDGEIIVETRKPALAFGAATVVPPSGGFVQASAAAEARMADLVLGHLAGCKPVADLFSGSGTFALRLAHQSAVTAVESDAAALAALDAAARHARGLKPVKTERRDLFRRPLMTAELKAFDGVAFDPPRAGGEAQAKELSRSAVKRIAAVSCNPVTLARDLRILVDGGYRIEAVHPIDQFLWSPHVEAVALLKRD
ncbi:MAG: class I SAM-dependent RNA methyltransferase [Pararhizobium sp.]